ncbi:hypothetical protein TFLX_03126 [Thermoflexales bacterium]|nr:hypothetical protein TFLX_03126 [Thermoflexales bacterium]
MAFYLVYEPCANCQAKNCLQCVQTDRQLTLRAVQAEDPPQNSINGPCEAPQDLLNRMVQFFDFDQQTGIMYFKR